jgi:hypothetical protein
MIRVIVYPPGQRPGHCPCSVCPRVPAGPTTLLPVPSSSLDVSGWHWPQVYTSVTPCANKTTSVCLRVPMCTLRHAAPGARILSSRSIRHRCRPLAVNAASVAKRSEYGPLSAKICSLDAIFSLSGWGKALIGFLPAHTANFATRRQRACRYVHRCFTEPDRVGCWGGEMYTYVHTITLL